MLKTLQQSVRRLALAQTNRRRLSSALNSLAATNRIPIFFIFTPDLVHIAPFCIPNEVATVQPIILLNGVSESDSVWIRNVHTDIPTVSLKASLSRNAKSMLSHAAVIDDLFATVDQPFCIQDPDCFVTDDSFYNAVSLDSKQHFAAGPFTKKLAGRTHSVPDTFFVLFNPEQYRQTTRNYGINADITSQLPAAAVDAIKKLGYDKSQYPEQFKGYFDTLQAYWLLSMADGFSFHKLDGDGTKVFHIGGTSYLKDIDYDLGHWDYWPLAVRYFHMRLMEKNSSEPFRSRFSYLTDWHGTPEKLLSDFPKFQTSERYRQVHIIMNSIETRSAVRR